MGDQRRDRVRLDRWMRRRAREVANAAVDDPAVCACRALNRHSGRPPPPRPTARVFDRKSLAGPTVTKQVVLAATAGPCRTPRRRLVVEIRQDRPRSRTRARARARSGASSSRSDRHPPCEGGSSRKRAVTSGEKSGSEVRDRPDSGAFPLEPAAQPVGLLTRGSPNPPSRRCAQPRISSPSGVKPSNARPRRTSGTPSSRSRLRSPPTASAGRHGTPPAARPKCRSRSSAVRYSSWRRNTWR